MPKQPVALEDLLRFQLAGDTQIAPDGRQVVFTLKRTDAEKNKYFTRLHRGDLMGGPSRTFTGDGHNDGLPRWSPDGGQIAFVSDRDKPGAQIYLLPADGGEAQKLTTLEEGGITELCWSPDGAQIAFAYRATPEAYREKAKKEREEKGFSPPVRVHRKLTYRLDAFGYYDDSFAQVWVVDAQSGAARQLTDAPNTHHSLAWSPDSQTLAFIANRRDDNDLSEQRDDLYKISVAAGDAKAEAGATSEPEQIAAPDGPKVGLAWSPDGQWLAYAGHTHPDDTWGGYNDRVLVIPATGASEARDLTGASDMSVGYLTLSDSHEAGGGSLIQWSPDSATLYFPLSAHGATRLVSAPLRGGNLTALTPDNHEMGAFSVSRDGRAFGILLGNATELYDAYIGEAGASGTGGAANGASELKLRRVSQVNQALLNSVLLQMPEETWLDSGEGARVQTWLLRPPDFDANAARQYPAIVYVHGGPAMQYGGQAAPFHELQWLAAQGYVVLFSNPRGSKGYGEAHTSAIKGDWGNRDWTDIQAVADYGAALPYVNADKMAIMGGSYGGYMTAWAVGHTDRFACGIADRLVGNLHSMAGTTDFAFLHGRHWKGNAWSDPADLWRDSPLAYAGNIHTPLLIIHSDGDLRCPVSQAEELFAALREQRKVVEFVRYPANSSHGMSRNGPPDLRLDRLRRNLEWLNRYLQ